MMLARSLAARCTPAESSAIADMDTFPEWLDDDFIRSSWEGTQPARSSSGSSSSTQPAAPIPAPKGRLLDRGCDRYLKQHRQRLRELAMKRPALKDMTMEEKIKYLGRLEWKRMSALERLPFIEEAATGSARIRNLKSGIFESAPLPEAQVTSPIAVEELEKQLKKKELTKLGKALVHVARKTVKAQGHVGSATRKLVAETLKTAGLSRRKANGVQLSTSWRCWKMQAIWRKHRRQGDHVAPKNFQMQSSNGCCMTTQLNPAESAKRLRSQSGL